MALTDNTATAAEIEAAVAANPALLGEIKAFATKGNFVMRSAEEEQTFLSGFEKQKVDARTFEIATGLEKDIFETTGIAKLENEKYHDYAKRVLGHSRTELTKMKSELDVLKADPGADKTRILQLEQAIANEKENAKGSLSKKDLEIQTLKSANEVEKALFKIRPKYVAGIPEFAIKATEDAVVGALLAKSKIIEGNFVILGDDGQPMLNPTTYKALTYEEYLTEKLGDLVDKQRKIEGTGVEQQQQQQQQQTVEGLKKDAAGAITEVVSIPTADIKNWQDLHAYLLKLGLTTDSPVFNTAFEKFKVNLPLR